jgi:hypothetical protein
MSGVMNEVMIRRLKYLVVLPFAATLHVDACDLCNVYSATQAQGEVGKGWFAGVAEQFTHFGTVQEDGREVANLADQSMESSISQALLGYNFSDRLGMQMTMPIIYRSFQRATGHGSVRRGSETGLGDMAVLGHWQVFSKEDKDFAFRSTLLGGLKLPTGSTSRLEEETRAHHHGAGAIESAIHGHDLTLGSGSVDGVVGASAFIRQKRVFVNGTLQYAIRAEGDFGYRYADDLTWSGGPGVFAALTEKYTLTIQANVSGETKGRDEFRGAKEDDTGTATVFLGPEVTFTWSDKLSAEIGVSFPVISENTGFQIVPDYRVRAGLVWHF